MLVDARGIDRAELLQALVDGTRPLGMGLLQAGAEFTVEQARAIVEDRERRGASLYFDYIAGRPIKTDLGEDDLDPGLYDRDAGDGQMARVVAQLRARLSRRRVG